MPAGTVRMKATWFGVDVARVLHLAAVFCLTCVLLKAIQLYHRRRELLRALSAFPGHPTHWLLGHVQEVRRGAGGRCGRGWHGGVGDVRKDPFSPRAFSLLVIAGSGVWM